MKKILNKMILAFGLSIMMIALNSGCNEASKTSTSVISVSDSTNDTSGTGGGGPSGDMIQRDTIIKGVTSGTRIQDDTSNDTSGIGPIGPPKRTLTPTTLKNTTLKNTTLKKAVDSPTKK